MMLKIIKIFFLTLISNYCLGQAGCFNNLNTRTTDPNELYASDGKNPNTVYLDAAHTQLNPNHFDWTDPSVNQAWYWDANISTPPSSIMLPYYCDINSNSNINGACTNQNIYYYKQLINSFNPSISLHDKNKAFDILPEDGWELMYKSFGKQGSTFNYASKQPTFVLYNRYTGKLKVFSASTGLEAGFVGISNINRAGLRVSFASNDKTAFFGNAQPVTQVLNAYSISPNQPNADHFMNNEFVTPNSVSQLNSGSGPFNPPEYQWLMSEFTVPYDPCTCWSINVPDLKISILYWSNSSINMAGTITGNLTAVPNDYYNGNNLDQSNKGAVVSTKGNVQNGIEGAMKGYETWSGYAEKVKGLLKSESGGGNTGISTTNIQINNIVNTWYSSTGQSGATTQQQKNTLYYNNQLGGSSGNADNGTKEMTGLNSAALSAASVIPYVGAFIGLVDALTAGGQENTVDNVQHVKIDNPPPPTNYDVNLKVQLSGNISTQTEPTPIYASVPGSKQTYNIIGAAPVYNNILGVLNVLNQPAFECTPLQITHTFSPYTNYNFPFSNQCLAHPVTYNGSFGNVNLPVLQYKLSQDVKYLINPASLLDVESIDACIVLEYDNTTNFEIANTNQLNNQVQIPYYSQIGQSNITLENRINLMKQSGLELEYTSKDFPVANNSIIRFRTPYTPIESIIQSNFLLYGSAGSINAPKAYLKLYCKLKRQNSSNADPVVIIQTFDISSSISNATIKPQISNAGTASISSSPVLTQFCVAAYAQICLVWVDGNGSHPCDISFDVNYPYATINSINVNSLAYPNIYIQPGPISLNNYSSSTAISYNTFNTPVQSNYLTSNVMFSTMDNIYFQNDLIQSPPQLIIGGGSSFNSQYYLTFTAVKGIYFTTHAENILVKFSNMWAGDEIVINNPVDVIIGEETELKIISKSTLMNISLGSYQATVIDNLANTNETNSVCQNGALRLANNQPDESLPIAKNKIAMDKFKIDIYPNPTIGDLTLNFKGIENIISISVEDITGKILMQKQAVVYDESNFNINISDFVSGMYIIKIVDSIGNTIKTDKIILVK